MKRALLLVVVIALGLISVALVTRNGGSGEWACPEDRIVHSIGDPVSGFPTYEEALRIGLFSMKDILGVRYSAADAALDADSGPDRVDRATGNVYVDNEIVAVVPVQRLSDGTFVSAGPSACPATAV